MHRWIWLIVWLAVWAVWPLPLARAAPATRLFPETGWQVGGRLLDYWQANGGLAVFGLPIGPEQALTVDGRAVRAQTFERARLELHAENAAPYDVLLGRLGADRLAQQPRPQAASDAPFGEPCQHFAATEQQVCGPFLAYWQARGLDLGDPGVSEREALALFGLPLTDSQPEMASDGATRITQWFERARFEFHPENPEPYRVLLGRLGAEVYGEPAPLPRPSVEALPGTAILQGRTLAVRAQFDQPVRGALGDQPLTFLPTPQGWTALAGVPATRRPGALPLSVQATLTDGRIAATSVNITVQDANYPVSYVNLPPEVQQSLASNQEALAQERREVNAIWPVVTPDKLWQGRWQMPTEGRMVSPFGPGRSYNGGPVNSIHDGQDIANSLGTPIVAPARGRVVLAKTDYVARGGAVILDHGWGVHSGYWHMEEVLVREGQLLEPGDLIGRMGTRGMSTAPHLHWELRIGTTSVDPLEWVEREWP